MSVKYKLETPKCSIKNAIQILINENLTKVNSSDNTVNNEDIELIINSNDLKKHSNNNNYIESTFIYIARVGAKFNGHTFAEQIVRSKNYFIGTEEHILKLALKNNEPKEWAKNLLSSPYFIPVNNLEKALNIFKESKTIKYKLGKAKVLRKEKLFGLFKKNK